MSDRTNRDDRQQRWIASRVQSAVEGLEIAEGALGELTFEAARVGNTVSEDNRTAFNDIAREIQALRMRLRSVSPISLPEDR